MYDYAGGFRDRQSSYTLLYYWEMLLRKGYVGSKGGRGEGVRSVCMCPFLMRMYMIPREVIKVIATAE
jgi:hypothetical protein